MNKQALIYNKPIPVSKTRHETWNIGQGSTYSFAEGLNAVPITTVEFAIAAREYPIVFVKGADKYSAAALLGLREGENLYLDESGKWKGRYVPGYLRRYPFVYSFDDEAKTYTLCIDEESGIAGAEVEGEAMFDDSGNETEYFKGVIAFNKNWQRAAQDTASFCERLVEMSLIVDSEIAFKLPDGESARTRGFAAVDRERFAALDKKAVSELFQGGDLESIYAHLLSLRSIDSLLTELPRELLVLD